MKNFREKRSAKNDRRKLPKKQLKVPRAPKDRIAKYLIESLQIISKFRIFEPVFKAEKKRAEAEAAAKAEEESKKKKKVSFVKIYNQWSIRKSGSRKLSLV